MDQLGDNITPGGHLQKKLGVMVTLAKIMGNRSTGQRALMLFELVIFTAYRDQNQKGQNAGNRSRDMYRLK